MEVLEGYSQTEILEALKSYRKTCEYNSAPTPASFKKFLHREVRAEETSERPKYIPDFAITRMNDDIRNGVNRHLLTVYKLAYDYCITDLLLKDIPLDDWKHMSEYQKHMLAAEKGILGNFDDVLVYICEKYYGKKYQYPSAAMLKGIDAKPKSKDFVSALATHWRDE